MFAVEEFIFTPTVGGLTLLKYMLLFMLVIHLPYMFCFMGGTLLSVIFNLVGKENACEKCNRFSQDLVERFTINKLMGLLLGIVPLATIIMILLQLLAGTPLTDYGTFWGELIIDNRYIPTPTAPYHIWLSLAMVAAGMGAVFFYRDTFNWRDDSKKYPLHLLAGLGGVLLVINGYLIFMAHKSFILYPTMWGIVDNPLALLFGSNILTSFHQFLFLAFSVTGAGIVFYFYMATDDGDEEVSEGEKNYREFARKVGLIMVLAFTLLQPVVAFADLWVLEEAAMSDRVVGINLLSILVGMGVATLAYLALVDSGKRFSGSFLMFLIPNAVVFTAIGLITTHPLASNLFLKVGYFLILMSGVVLTMILFGAEKSYEGSVVALVGASVLLFVALDHTTRANALTEHMQSMEDRALSMAPKDIIQKMTISDRIKAGQRYFQNNCTACHNVDGQAGGTGPTFKDLYGKKELVVTGGKEREITVDDAYLSTAMKNPAADLVKGYANLMNIVVNKDEDVKNLIYYIKSLSKDGKQKLAKEQAEEAMKK